MKTFLISDTHFGHSNILKFKKEDGSPLRVFSSIEEMDEYLIYKWNSVVSPCDKVYHLGDVGFKNFTALSEIINRLNGTKVLIKGNHDNFKMSQYAQLFKDVRATHTLDGFILSHIPLHTQSVSRWKGNIHGHLHSYILDDPRYLNVSVEVLDDYTPVDFERVRQIFKERGIEGKS
jgi:calcineurin-like phosphoesterase family protein